MDNQGLALFRGKGGREMDVDVDVTAGDSAWGAGNARIPFLYRRLHQ